MRAKTKPAAVVLQAKAELITADQATADAVAGIAAGYTKERDLVNQLLGQAQMAGAFEDFSRTVRISKLAFVKENRLYKVIAGQETPHGAEKLAGTWEEFCSLLNRSVDQVDRDIANLKAFGEEALESMARMGIGYRELRQYRRLPEDEKTALIEVAKAGDKEAFVELAEEIITRHAREKETYALQLQSKDDVLASKQKLVDYQAGEIDALSEKARFIAVATPSEKLDGIRTELLAHAAGIEGALAGKLRPAFAALKDHLSAHGGECDAYLNSALGQIERAVREIREDFGLLREEDVAAWSTAE